MELRWSSRAADDLERIANRIRKDSSEAAQRVALALYEGVGHLREYPHSGRPGREEGSRELVYPRLPYLAVYRVRDDVVEISRIIHGRQRWPA
jgi:addiction module RelE/StbE family toxin